MTFMPPSSLTFHRESLAQESPNSDFPPHLEERMIGLPPNRASDKLQMVSDLLIHQPCLFVKVQPNGYLGLTYLVSSSSSLRRGNQEEGRWRRGGLPKYCAVPHRRCGSCFGFLANFYAVVQSPSRVPLLRPHGLQPIRLLHSWDSPGKNIGVGCHFLLQGIS